MTARIIQIIKILEPNKSFFLFLHNEELAKNKISNNQPLL